MRNGTDGRSDRRASVMITTNFTFVGSNRDFIAQRDGVLFLGVNESNLNDNSGAYETVVEAEAVSSSAAR